MHRYAFCIGAILWIPLFLAFQGCGKKTLPLPEVRQVLPEISIEKADITGEGIVISWKLPETGEIRSPAGKKHKNETGRFENYPYCFVVEKAEISRGGTLCMECPDLPWEQSTCLHPAFPGPAAFDGRTMKWKDGNVRRGHAYRYRVVVYDVGTQRPLVYSSPFDLVVSEPPVSIEKGNAKSDEKGIFLTWFLPANGSVQKNAGEIRFAVERRSEASQWKRVDAGDLGNTSYLDTEVKPGMTYEYRVTPYLKKGAVTVWGTPFVLPPIAAEDRMLPPPPKTVWVVPGKEGLEIHWLEVTKPVKGYHVYRKYEDGTILRLTQQPVEHPPFIDKGVKKNVVYFYAVSSLSPYPPYREGLVSSWVEIRNVFSGKEER
ncbi:fibronectin type III domain-containing protein [Thermodesulforhabdus norvegica]|uniref:Fibronectin type-III domain-containing protein n=1 Tax=Thermodesulforhabdus norvegica TaxID=39841 RepID=A0A1I4W508_9BACT|nr:fibronectin type III domain-containing protein [Thermodesulforhabdus norvegica]SFN08641.1 hypothetical protein SAMN05660836_02608 [Thermodesulforhabdus norvegica]